MCHASLVLLAWSALSSEIDAEVIDIETEILSARRSIASADVEWTSERTHGHQKFHRVCRIRFDSRGSRRDLLVPYSESLPLGLRVTPDYATGAMFRQITSRSGGKIVSYTDAELAGGKRLMLEIRALEFADESKSHQIPDIRLLGLATLASDNLVYASLNQVFDRGDRVSARIADEELNGTDCRLITESFVGGTVRQIWVDPTRQNVPLRVRFTQGEASEEVESEYQYLSNVGIWFPRVCRFRTVDGNGEVHNSETLTVNRVSVNQELDGDVFQLASMSIKPGVRVLELPPNRGGQLYWNGSEIAARDFNPVFNDRPVRMEGRSRLYWILLANGVVFGSLALFFLVRAFRPKASPP